MSERYVSLTEDYAEQFTPPSTVGYLYLYNILMDYADSGFTMEPQQLLNTVSYRFGITSDSLRRAIQKSVRQSWSAGRSVHCWTMLFGWHGAMPPPPLEAIRLLCAGYIKQLDARRWAEETVVIG